MQLGEIVRVDGGGIAVRVMMDSGSTTSSTGNPARDIVKTDSGVVNTAFKAL
jgi:hypothetical protein